MIGDITSFLIDKKISLSICVCHNVKSLDVVCEIAHCELEFLGTNHRVYFLGFEGEKSEDMLGLHLSYYSLWRN